MTVQEVLIKLEAYGDENTKNTLMKHGAKEPFIGVKIQERKTPNNKTNKNKEREDNFWDYQFFFFMSFPDNNLNAIPKKRVSFNSPSCCFCCWCGCCCCCCCCWCLCVLFVCLFLFVLYEDG